MADQIARFDKVKQSQQILKRVSKSKYTKMAETIWQKKILIIYCFFQAKYVLE